METAGHSSQLCCHVFCFAAIVRVYRKLIATVATSYASLYYDKGILSFFAKSFNHLRMFTQLPGLQAIYSSINIIIE